MTEQSAYEEIFALIKTKLDNPDVIYTLHDKVGKFPTLGSGVAVIDECLNGGLPRGKLIELFGGEAGGKTTTTLHFIAAAQQRGDIVYFIDAEHALDPQYAARIGVNFDTLMFSQPDTGEQALETVRIICEATQEVSDKYGRPINTLVIVDSIPALIPAELVKIWATEGLESSNALGAVARMLAQKIPMIAAAAGKSGTTVVLINQMRDLIGVTYGAKTTTPGGRTVKFFASLRLKITRVGYYDRGGTRAGIRVQLVPVKSKQFPIFNRVAEYIIGPDGINTMAAVIEVAIKKKVIKKKGAWFSYGSIKKQGREAFDDAFKEQPDVFAQLQTEMAEQEGGLTTTIALTPATQPAKPAASAPPVSPALVTQPIPAAQPASATPVAQPAPAVPPKLTPQPAPTSPQPPSSGAIKIGGN